MDVGRYLVEAHLREGRTVAELARTHSVHRRWRYLFLERYRRLSAVLGLAAVRLVDLLTMSE